MSSTLHKSNATFANNTNPTILSSKFNVVGANVETSQLFSLLYSKPNR